MKKWIYKTLMASVAVLTLGLITPNHEIWKDLELERDSNRVQASENDITSALQLDAFLEEEQQPVTIEQLVSAAKEQSYIKFGSRIAPVIENEFESIIFPKMEEAIAMTVARLDNEDLRTIAITENPSGNYNEKIFNINNTETKKDIIRFHVRTENRPFEGYYYNFHYHTYEDNFQKHHDIGNIYWSKNTPPKWLS